MFGLGPTYLFVLQHRAPFGLMRGAGWTPWISTMATNAGIALCAAGIMWLIGVGPFLLDSPAVVMLSASMGVWLFYVQHQFEETHWAREPAWSHPEAALHGSSHYDLPLVLRWFTANIGVHHVHHLNSRIPYLSSRRGAARPSGIVGRRPADPVAEPAMRPPDAVGRRAPGD